MQGRHRRWKRASRRGAATVLVALSLVAVIGVVALAVDAGMLFDTRRSVQAAADAAAMAAAVDIFDNFGTNLGLDPNGTGNASALATAKANGFSNDGVSSIVTVNIPPSSGIASGTTAYAEVIVQANQKRGFSYIFGSVAVPVQARAVACGNPGSVGIYILEPSDSDCFAVDGYLKVLNDGVVNVNSSATGAGQIADTATLITGGINLVGTLKNNGGSITYTGGGSLHQGAASVADPLANVPDPTESGTNYGDVTYTVDQTIQPGIYHNMTINWGVDVIMSPGIYYINGGIHFQGPPAGKPGGTLSGSEVMIYNNSGDHLDFQQAGPISLSPPTSGAYRGIVLFQPRSSNQQIHIESKNNVTLLGTLYAKNGFFDLRPDGSGTVFTLGTYVANNIEACEGNDLTHNSNGQIHVNPGAGVSTLRPLMVE